jgi:hypothetical protein
LCKAFSFTVNKEKIMKQRHINMSGMDGDRAMIRSADPVAMMASAAGSGMQGSYIVVGGGPVRMVDNSLVAALAGVALADALADALAEILADELAGSGSDESYLGDALTDLLADLLAFGDSSADDLAAILTRVLADSLVHGGTTAETLAVALAGERSLAGFLESAALIEDVATALNDGCIPFEVSTTALKEGNRLAETLAEAIRSALRAFSVSFISMFAIGLSALNERDAAPLASFSFALAGGATVSDLFIVSLESGDPFAETIVPALLSAITTFVSTFDCNLDIALSGTPGFGGTSVAFMNS